MLNSPGNFHKESFDLSTHKRSVTKKQLSRLAWFRLISFCGILIGFWFLLKNDTTGYILISLCSVLFLIAVRRYNDAFKESKILDIRIKLHALELEAMEGNYSGFDAGKRFIDSEHSSSFDLDVFGEHSLFNQVCRSVTPEGSKQLSELFATPVSSIHEIEKRQEWVKEFSANPQFLIDFRVSVGGIGKASESNFQFQLINWIQTEHPFLMSRWIRFSVAISTLSICVLLVLKLILSIPFSWLVPPLLFNFLLLGGYIRKISSINSQSGSVSEATGMLHKMLLVVQNADFKSERLASISDESKRASISIYQLHSLLNVFDIRLNIILGVVLNLFFLFDFHCLIRIENWKRKYAGLIQKSYGNLTFIDVYQSLGNWAYLHPTNKYPIFTEHDICFAEDLKHPLIHARDAIGNTLNLGKNEKLVVLTGANMTGKSTWLRTIGLSCIAANSGLPVSGSNVTLPLLNVFTSMRITDSLDTGISYFRAELNRLKRMLETLSNSDQTWLVLLDEPLRGTNSGDKQAGTIGLINRLLKLPAIGLVATHDAALCELKFLHSNRLSNFHFDSTLDGVDLLFDYRLKEGCSTSTNATILMQLTGILDT